MPREILGDDVAVWRSRAPTTRISIKTITGVTEGDSKFGLDFPAGDAYNMTTEPETSGLRVPSKRSGQIATWVML